MIFKLDMGDIAKNLIEKEIKTMAALNLYGDSASKEMEAYAKSNRPWQDRTGEARKRLKGNKKNIGTVVRCQIEHGVDYGIFLEMKNEGKYAILKPTVQAVGPKVVNGLDKIFK